MQQGLISQTTHNPSLVKRSPGVITGIESLELGDDALIELHTPAGSVLAPDLGCLFPKPMHAPPMRTPHGLLTHPNGCCPAFCTVQGVCVGEAAHKDDATEAVQAGPAINEVAHGDVPGLQVGAKDSEGFISRLKAGRASQLSAMLCDSSETSIIIRFVLP